jgi:hypothetical protein
MALTVGAGNHLTGDLSEFSWLQTDHAVECSRYPDFGKRQPIRFMRVLERRDLFATPLDVLGAVKTRQSEPTNGSQLAAGSDWPRCASNERAMS